MRYKLWLQIEQIDDDADTYENVSEPVCIGDFDTHREAEEKLYGLALLHGGIMPEERTYLASLLTEVNQP